MLYSEKLTTDIDGLNRRRNKVLESLDAAKRRLAELQDLQTYTNNKYKNFDEVQRDRQRAVWRIQQSGLRSRTVESYGDMMNIQANQEPYENVVSGFQESLHAIHNEIIKAELEIQEYGRQISLINDDIKIYEQKRQVALTDERIDRERAEARRNGDW
ncbi:hypothetical protein OZX74_00890 [Bifidobacterium sp. ESL0798]|uniref:hypothetical protein n=1 Tax=Bifidobacterium sp. ESL0798 TaxID=2983235 RepID=UPI0023F9A9A3|nr:hypothetical protein [Bifidobacterium sp. ESL0798]WEV74155.1 hypothetical protein OZX74_00890 [Bifidobacterium sp. ESL0798]